MQPGQERITPPIEPMLAKPAPSATLDQFHQVAFEPKWDGFRCLVFHLSSGIVLQGRGRSRSNAEVVDLAYAFPELVEWVAGATATGTVLDAEIVVRSEGHLDFGALAARLRPRAAAQRESIVTLAQGQPACLLVFDLLANPVPIMALPFIERRNLLREACTGWGEGLMLTPSTEDRSVAERWFNEYEQAGVDGLIAKPLHDPYIPGKRTQWKIKHHRTADMVVAGWRPQRAKDGSSVVGSLLLGLYDSDGALQYVGGTAAFTDAVRRELLAKVAPYRHAPTDSHPWLGSQGNRVPGGATRWGPGKDWEPLRPELVVEVTYDQLQGPRFRHPVSFSRWRPDRDPTTCGFDQFPPTMSTSISGLLDSAAP
ncbi:MAG: ATP-dependent DNA ligase [Actinomycetales bacterium]